MNKKILIIEDDPVYRGSIKLALADKGYTFFETSYAQEGLSLLDDHPDIQVILLDLKLPALLSGTDFLARIKEKSSRHRVIVLTGHDEMLDSKMADELRVFAYQPKAIKFSGHSLQFVVDQAFKDLEGERLRIEFDRHLKIQESINSNEPLDETLNLICEYALEQTGSYTCHIRVLDLKRGDFELRACNVPFPSAKAIFPDRKRINEYYSTIVAEMPEPEPKKVPDLQNDEPFLKMKQQILNSGKASKEEREYLDKVKSAYIIPISSGVFDGQVDAVLNINSVSESFFDDEERCKTIRDFASQAANAIAKNWHRTRRGEIHQDYSRLSNMLVDVSKLLKAEWDLNKIFEVVNKHIYEIVSPEVVSIFLYNPLNNLLERVAEYPQEADSRNPGEAYEPGKGFTGLVYSTGRTIRFPSKDLNAISSNEELEALYKGLNGESKESPSTGRIEHYLGVPLRIGDNVIGVIRALNKRSSDYNELIKESNIHCLLKRGFSEDCQIELEIAASHLAVAKQNAELVGQLQVINKVGRIISSVDADDLLKEIVGLTAKFIKAEVCLLFLKNEKGDRVELKESEGIPLIQEAYYDIGEGKTGRVADTGKSILEKRAEEAHIGKYDSEIIELLRAKTSDSNKEIESFMAVPILGKGQVLGVIKVLNKVGGQLQFDEEDLNLLEIFASQIGLERYIEVQRYRNIIQSSPDPIIVLDEKGHVKIFSTACEGLWGYKFSEVRGKSVVMLYESYEKAKAVGDKLQESGKIENFETKIKHKSGELIPISLSASLLFNEKGEEIGSEGVFKDLRELKRLQEENIESAKLSAIGQLARNVTHDIRHDIGTALNYLEVLLDGSVEQSELKDIYTTIKDALRNVVEELKDVTQAGKPRPYRKEAHYIESIFRDVQAAMMRQANARGIEFSIDYSANGREIMLDSDAMRRVLWNLYDNSVDAIEAKKALGQNTETGRIEVSSSINDNLLELLWKDNGCGIAEEDKPHIFTVFFTKKVSGSGLGLSNIRSIIEAHEGQIFVESTPGKGTCFKIIIPILDSHSAEESAYNSL